MGYNASHMIFGLVTGGVRHPSLWSSVERAKISVEQFIMEDWGPDNFHAGREKFVWTKPELAWRVEVHEADGTWVSDFDFRVWALPLSERFSDEWSQEVVRDQVYVPGVGDQRADD